MAEASIPIALGQSDPLWRKSLTALRALGDAVLAARGQLLPFATMAFALGIGLWFAWPSEPGRGLYLAALALFCLCGGVIWRGPERLAPFMIFALWIVLGFAIAGARAHLVASPFLTFRYYGPVEGRVIEIDRSGSNALRLTLDQPVLERMAPAATPKTLRISLHGQKGVALPQIGERVIATAHLAPPEAAVEPGGFDFRRMAYFDQLGALGYSRSPVLVLEAAAPQEAWIGRLRAHFSAGIKRVIPGEAGAFAAGAMTGDRSGISQQTVEALRDSSLAHILAISGMNLAFLTGFVFGLLRGAVALVPGLALRVNAKKLAAVVAFAAAAFYLALSGANVATERAFYMVTVMLGAVLLDRRALTLRSAGLAGMVILLREPEALLSPGLQMSFAATLALIVGFQWVQDHMTPKRGWPWGLRGLFAAVASAVIGGFATAPFAAAHFNRFADYGLLANLLTVPAMGVAIMPMGVLAFLLEPLGLEAVPLWVMGLASQWILTVAYGIAALEGAVTAIPAPGGAALAVFALGAAWALFWPGRAALLGLGIIAVSAWLWASHERPALLISADGKLLGLMGPEGRALSSAQGGGFAAQNWLENDGDLAGAKAAALRPGFDGPKAARQFHLGRYRAVALSGPKAAEDLGQACHEFDLVILAGIAEVAPPGCALIDQIILRQSGALAFYHEAGGYRLEAARAGGRLWHGAPADLSDLRALLPKGIALAR